MQTIRGNGAWQFKVNSSWAKLPAGISRGGTHAIVAPDGDIWISNGYSDSRLLRFDTRGDSKRIYAWEGSADGEFHTSHSLCVDTGLGEPLMLVVDRENRRLVHLDFDGNFVRTHSRGVHRLGG